MDYSQNPSVSLGFLTSRSVHLGTEVTVSHNFPFLSLSTGEHATGYTEF